MKYIFLSSKFYSDYSNCPELEQKQDRPYIMLLIKIDNLTFALPLRSNIKHKYAYFSDKVNNCGADFSKAVVISKPEYIDTRRIPRIRQNEYKALENKDYVIALKFKRYLDDYKKACLVNANRMQYKFAYCTLQYFHKELGL